MSLAALIVIDPSANEANGLYLSSEKQNKVMLFQFFPPWLDSPSGPKNPHH
jgi:hypothetical protein